MDTISLGRFAFNAAAQEAAHHPQPQQRPHFLPPFANERNKAIDDLLVQLETELEVTGKPCSMMGSDVTCDLRPCTQYLAVQT